MSSNPITRFQLDRGARVVGTIITGDFLRAWNAAPTPLAGHLVELRIDGFPEFPEWPEIGKRIEEAGSPVIATVRFAREGGKWTNTDRERLPLIDRALGSVSAVDIELMSEISHEVCRRAREHGRASVVSYHNFEHTPPLRELREIVARAFALGDVAKIAAKVNSPQDLQNLRTILQERGDRALCVIGMGPIGRETRLNFPREGSCLTYGYLDEPGAPGQYSAAELVKHLTS